MKTKIRTSRCSYWLSAPDNDHIGRVFQSGCPYEHDLLKALRPFVRNGSAVIDAGANVGNHTIYFAAVCGATVHAFEPNPEARRWLEENVSANELGHRIVVHTEALGAADGTARLAFNEHGLPTVKAVSDPEGEIRVVPLDTLNVGNVSLIKIDVEGAEEDVISGAVKTISINKPVIAAEAQTIEQRDNLDAQLVPFGYSRFPIMFAATPTWIYLPRRKQALRLTAQPHVIRRVRQLRSPYRT